MKKNNNDQKLLKFLGGVAIGFIAGTILTPPAAAFIGSYTLFTAKCVEQMVEEEDKATFRFIGECGKDIAVGGLFKCLVGTNSVSLFSQETNSIGHLASEEIAQHGISEIAKELIDTGKEISEWQKKYKHLNDLKDIKDASSILIEITKHKIHLDKGVDYLESCEICNV